MFLFALYQIQEQESIENFQNAEFQKLVGKIQKYTWFPKCKILKENLKN